YLIEVQESIIKNRENFQQRQDTGENQQPGMPRRPQQDPFYEYSVNLLIDNSKLEKRPTITEVNPNFKNIFGSIERMIDRQGFWRTDFTRLKPGALHRANGGFLVLDAFDTLIEPGVWQGLKRTLRSGKLEIQAYDPVFLYSSSAMKPQPVEIDLKVILIGMPEIYYLLYKLDPIFTKIFKVKADFDTVMDHNDTNLANYNQIARRMVEDHNLLPFDRDGVGALVEYGVRLAGRKNKLSTRFNLIADVMREADHWARKDNSESVKEQHVDKAIDEWIRRVSLVEDKIDELIEQNTLLIDTEGKVVGQINGLSVYNLGEYMFGKPTRITARTSVGSKGIINIEKEAQLSGSTHSKGVMIISGYLQSKFAQNRPLSMNAHLCFEQSYGGVDGDSASSTEIYAILSSLAEVPIRQDIAVTGSVNQLGRVQAIGGVNQKVEGFFKICREKGFTGEQGVMIPKSNVPELMLRKEVVQAVKDGKFSIYSVETIEEGVEILTGMKAGEQKKDGSYPKGTLFHLVEQRLEQYAQVYKKYTGEHSD
ncbi:MAG: AAA family ATPase, partial [candidate division Zixibacteria bacterium]|nr:AAA family ATPase [candidate division Zixibacteria bacterium]